MGQNGKFRVKTYNFEDQGKKTHLYLLRVCLQISTVSRHSDSSVYDFKLRACNPGSPCHVHCFTDLPSVSIVIIINCLAGSVIKALVFD